MRKALLLALFAGAAVAQPAKDAAKGPPAMPVKAVAARAAPAIDEAGAVGSLRADEAVTIRPEIAGRIVEIRFSEGQNVARGARAGAAGPERARRRGDLEPRRS